MTVLFFAGMGVILAGLLAIGLGIPVKEFGFGNTLILTGTVGACTGLIMLSLVAVLRELTGLAQRLVPNDRVAVSRSIRESPGKAEAGEPEGESGDQASANEGALFSRDQSAVERAATADAALPPWQQDAPRDRSRGSTAPADTAEPAPESKQRRNLLFSSSRREREQAAAERASGTTDHDHTAVPGAASDTPRATFDDAWPQIDRTRPEVARRSPRMPSTFKEAEAVPPPAERFAPPRHEVAAEVTVLKSGVVDGMSYSLYSDGSIEAQMPEGMMRFASIDELREHLDHRA